jgi:hypothetical protein
MYPRTRLFGFHAPCMMDDAHAPVFKDVAKVRVGGGQLAGSVSLSAR